MFWENWLYLYWWLFQYIQTKALGVERVFVRNCNYFQLTAITAFSRSSFVTRDSFATFSSCLSCCSSFFSCCMSLFWISSIILSVLWGISLHVPDGNQKVHSITATIDLQNVQGNILSYINTYIYIYIYSYILIYVLYVLYTWYYIYLEKKDKKGNWKIKLKKITSKIITPNQTLRWC